MTRKHIPNALTLFRLALIAPFLMCLYAGNYVNALYLYLCAGFTDGLDGWLARYFNWQTSFGSFIDPLADKLLVGSSFIALALLHVLPWWLVVLVFMRDVTISMGVVAWFWFIQSHLDFKPILLSKFNTALQLILVTSCLFQLAFFEFPQHYTDILICLTALTTILTYINYVWTWGRKALLVQQP